MVREIIKDQIFLAKKSVDATKEDAQLVRDLQDTLRAHLEECVGMAANMIGENKNIIVYVHNGFVFAMINPVIIDKDYGVIAGHGRLMAAKAEGIEEVPCVYAEHLTEAQKKALRTLIADLRKQFGANLKVVGHHDYNSAKACPCFDVKAEKY